MYKQDIWESKYWFKNEVKSIIVEQNEICLTMQELEQNVLKCVKDLIHLERPVYLFVDGPWKEYVKRYVANPRKYITTSDEDSFINE